jgi:hypothetical protein
MEQSHDVREVQAGRDRRRRGRAKRVAWLLKLAICRPPCSLSSRNCCKKIALLSFNLVKLLRRRTGVGKRRNSSCNQENKTSR